MTAREVLHISAPCPTTCLPARSLRRTAPARRAAPYEGDGAGSEAWLAVSRSSDDSRPPSRGPRRAEAPPVKDVLLHGVQGFVPATVQPQLRPAADASNLWPCKRAREEAESRAQRARTQQRRTALQARRGMRYAAGRGRVGWHPEKSPPPPRSSFRLGGRTPPHQIAALPFGSGWTPSTPEAARGIVASVAS